MILWRLSHGGSGSVGKCRKNGHVEVRAREGHHGLEEEVRAHGLDFALAFLEYKSAR